MNQIFQIHKYNQNVFYHSISLKTINTNNNNKPNPKQNIIGPAKSASCIISLSNERNGFNDANVFL